MSRVSWAIRRRFHQTSVLRSYCVADLPALPQSPDILCHWEHSTVRRLSVLLEKLNLESLVTPSTSCRTLINRCSNSSMVTFVFNDIVETQRLSWHRRPPNLVTNWQQRRDDRYKVLRICGTDLDAARSKFKSPTNQAASTDERSGKGSLSDGGAFKQLWSQSEQ